MSEHNDEISKNDKRNEIDFSKEKDRNQYRHTTSHILAQAVKHLFPM